MIKLAYYQKIRVPEYWLVDPEARTIERLVLKKGEYTIVQTASNEQKFRPKSFDDLEIPLAKLWQ